MEEVFVWNGRIAAPAPAKRVEGDRLGENLGVAEFESRMRTEQDVDSASPPGAWSATPPSLQPDSG